MFLSVANAWPALDNLARISLLELRSAVILDSMYVKSSTSSVFRLSCYSYYVLDLCYVGFESNFVCGSGKLLCI